MTQRTRGDFSDRSEQGALIGTDQPVSASESLIRRSAARDRTDVAALMIDWPAVSSLYFPKSIPFLELSPIPLEGLIIWDRHFQYPNWQHIISYDVLGHV
jgi:hypothetical protein